MTAALDPRLVRMSVIINGVTKSFTGLSIRATGTKYVNALQNEMEITIYNLDKQTQDYILTETTPYNLNLGLKTVLLEAGRQSYGYSTIYLGNIYSSSVSQPPDIGLTLRCLSGNNIKSNVLALNFAGPASIEHISQQLAQNAGLALNYQATDPTPPAVSNYSYNGNQLGQVGDIAAVGQVDAYIDDGIFVVKNRGKPLANKVRILNADTGMIGIPEFTEWGVKVKFLLDNTTSIGGAIQIQSKIYPAINGTYVIYKLGFEISNRETPFYYIAEGTSNGLFPLGIV